MQYSEFLTEFHRLCEGFVYKPKPPQLAAFYDRLKHCDSRDWTEAATDLLCAPRFPASFDVVLEAIERRAQQRRRASNRRESTEANRFLDGRASAHGSTPEEEEYNQFRMDLLLSALGKSPRGYASHLCESLSAWITDPQHARWADGTIMNNCGFHSGNHKLSYCVAAEIQYWNWRAEGKSEQEARMLLGSLAA
jgi:hypothetical protein